MALQSYNITGSEWTAITTAGQDGSCWLNSMPTGGGRCMIYHSTTVPDDDTDVTLGKPLFVSVMNNDVLTISSDSTSDIYYAKMSVTAGTATVIVDVV